MAEELSPSAYARRVGATTRSVQRWIALGKLPARRVGGRWRVAFDAFEPTERPIRRLFIANRGEIARRIRRTCDRLGIEAIEPATDGAGAVDLLDIDAVVAAARQARADALHPGFGFLAENPDFAEAVETAGMAWVGPPSGAIRAMGDKAAARRLAQDLGVPVVPGYDGEAQSDPALVRVAARIGYPLLVKPAGGGGGKGMREVRDPSRLRDALAGARREALASFGDDRLILERLIEGPRHVEVQVLFDGDGRGVHLGERDCSTQRRHQKVLEETPSPAVTPAIRRRLTSYALRLAGAVGYRSAGTCEFLLTNRREVFFLEMNTRLQVEHPVTELVTGIDLVEEQLRIAEGRRLALRQADVDERVAAGGHAIEVRLYAEDAEDGFLPATGRVERLAWPSGTGIRVDAGIDEGTLVGARFDPMLAKIAAHGADRAEALDRLTTALDQTAVLGLTTNLRFLRWLVRQGAVRDGQVRIDTLARIWPPSDWTERAEIPDEAWRVAASVLGGDGGRGGQRSPGASSWLGGWRLNGPARIRLESDGLTRTVSVTPPAPAPGVNAPRPSVVVAGDVAHVVAGDVAYVDVAGRSVAFRLAAAPDVDRAARGASGAHHGAGGPVDVSAPMPGAILAIHVTPGAAVDAGDPIATLEAMKMEHAVPAATPGRVVEVRVRPGDQVARGDVLAVVES